MNLNSIRTNISKQRCYRVVVEAVVPLGDVAMGAGRQATSTSVATPVVNSCGQSDGIRRTDPFTGTGTVGRARPMEFK